MRTFSSPILAALGQGELVLRALVKLQLVEGDFGFWNDIGNVVIDGVTYVGTGSLASISTLPGTTTGSIPNWTLTLSGLDEDVLATFFTYTWHQQPVQVYLGCLDPQTMAFVDAPVLFASGRLDSASIKGGADSQATLTINCEDISRRLTWPNPAVRSNGDQLGRSATDTFFQYVATTAQQQLYWGEKQPVPTHAALTPTQLLGTLISRTVL